VVRFGILGTARVARAFFEQPIEGVQIVGIASRELLRAEAFAREFNISKSFGSYEEMLGDPLIDAVYIPLPHSLHCEYAIRSASAKKHVLVEKPAALSVAELTTMLASCKANNVLFMEGFMYRFMRIHNRVKEVSRSGEIGNLRFIDFSWSHNIRKKVSAGFRMERRLGGGSLHDLGIYGIDFIRFITEREPKLLSAYMQREYGNGADVFTQASFQAEDVFAAVTCGYHADANYYHVCGDAGSVYAPVSLSGRTIEGILQFHLLDGDRRYEERFAPENPYRLEMEYFARCVEKGEQPSVGGENSLRNIRIVEEILHHHAPLPNAWR
jgi:D-xylose 1-dehydrogenase (NADP+, D-xylono-1,5-lactone-forming)